MASPSLIERAKGALLGTFTGDALGMPFEGMPSPAIPPQLEMTAARLGRGTYTDDTEMMIVLAELLAERGGVDADALARGFLERHDPRRGYGTGTLTVFSYWCDGVPVHTAAKLLFGGQGSLGNGAAMRIAPVGVRFAFDAERLCDEAQRSAAITHAHRLGIDAATAQAVAVGAATRNDDVLGAASAAVHTREMRRKLTAVEELLSSRSANPGNVAHVLGNSAAAPQSVAVAIYAACQADDFAGAVTFAVRCGGDTDTIGAMAGAIAGARHGVGSIPSAWLDALEDGPTAARTSSASRGGWPRMRRRLLARGQPGPRPTGLTRPDDGVVRRSRARSGAPRRASSAPSRR